MCRPSIATAALLGVAVDVKEAIEGTCAIPADALEGVAEDADETYEGDGEGKVREGPAPVRPVSWVLTS